jgi:hypothetical protein
MTRRRLAATRRARYVTLRLPQRQLRDLARRRATTLTVETSAAGARTLRRRIVVLGARQGASRRVSVQHHIQGNRPGRDRP